MTFILEDQLRLHEEKLFYHVAQAEYHRKRLEELKE